MSKRVAGVGAEHGEGGEPAAVHEDPRVGQILGAVRALGVDVGEEEPGVLDLLVEGVVGVAVEHVGAVHDVGRGRDLQRRNGRRRSGRAAVEEADEHDLALHDSRHVVLDVLVASSRRIFLASTLIFSSGLTM